MTKEQAIKKFVAQDLSSIPRECTNCDSIQIRRCTDDEIRQKELLQSSYICVNCDFTYGEDAYLALPRCINRPKL